MNFKIVIVKVKKIIIHYFLYLNDSIFLILHSEQSYSNYIESLWHVKISLFFQIFNIVVYPRL